MKNMKKVLAALLALTMTVCLASCGETGGNGNAGGTAENSRAEESQSEEKEESKTEEKEEESETEEAEVTEAADTETESAAFEVGAESVLKNGLFDITAEYSVPAVKGYAIQASDKKQFGSQAKDYFYYNPASDAEKVNKFSFGINLFTSDKRNADNNISDYQKDDSKKEYRKSANGYDVCIKVDEKTNEKDALGPSWNVFFVIYGEKYLDGFTQMNSSFDIHQCDMSRDEVIDFVMAIADSLKITVNEDYLTSDGICRMGSHAITLPVKVKLAENEYDAEPYLFSSEQFIRINPVIDGVKYEISTGLMLTKDSFEKDAADEKYKRVTLAGKDAAIRLDKEYMSINCFADLMIDEKTVLQLSVKSDSFADGKTTNADGKMLIDVCKEMTDEEHFDETVDKITGWLDEFVSQMKFNSDPAYNGEAERIDAELKNAAN